MFNFYRKPGRKPNTFLIGAPKCGTSAMATYLSTNPSVFVPHVKEPRYWAEELDQAAAHPLSLAEYERLFSRAAPDQKCLIDASTCYVWSETAIPRILNYAPDAKFVVMFRDPLEVVQALHMEYCNLIEEDLLDFEAAWNAQEDRRRGQRIPRNCPAPLQLQYKHVVSFGIHLQRLLGMIPDDRLCVIIYDDFKADPAAAYESVLHFLGISSDARKEFPIVNQSRTTRLYRIKRFLQSPPRGLAPIENALRQFMWWCNLHGIRHNILKRLFDYPAKRQPISINLAERLSAEFADDVLLLGQLLKRDLSHWCQPARDGRFGQTVAG
jgi:hypothetical protein